jgi:predicted permease
VREPGQLVLYSPGDGGGRQLGLPTDEAGRLGLFSYPLYRELRDGDRSVELAAQDSNLETSVVRGPGPADDASERAEGRTVSANFFSVLGVPAHRGRTFLPEDETAPGANPVVVLSHGYWQRRFGSSNEILGTTLNINGTAYTVLGVTAPGFVGADTGQATDFWVPVTMANEFGRFGIDLNLRSYWWMSLVGRLPPGTSMEAVQARANVIFQQYLASDAGIGANAEQRARANIRLGDGSTGASQVRRQFREPLLVLMVGVGLLLLIVCLNVSYLLLARATRRQYELSIRTALGASRMRLVRQLLAEGLLLAMVGALFGAVLTYWLKDGLLAMVSTGDEPLALDTSPDGRVIWFVALVSLVTALLIGLAPALQASRSNLQQAMRATSAAVTSGGSRRLLSRTLLVSQVAFSVVLLVGAGLLAGSLGKLRQTTSGFDEEHVLLAGVNVQMSGLEGDHAQRVYDEVRRRVGMIPGVHSVSLSVPSVLNGGRMGWMIRFPGTNRQPQGVQLYLVTPGYFETLGMRLLRGRAFERTDGPAAPRVAVVNESMARKMFAGAEALGQRISMDGVHDVTVVGVVSDAKNNDLRQPIDSVLFLTVAQPHGTPATILPSSLEVRAAGDPSLLAHQVRRAVREAHSGLPFMNVRTLKAQVDRTLTKDRLLATLATGFGLAALFLVALGLYGVIAQWAAQRTREIGVRMALGATSGGVRWLVLRQGVALVMVGLVLGIPAALAASRLLEGLLFGVQPMDPKTVTVAALAMFAVAALAAYLPARRASRVDPMAALRCE